MNLPEHTTHSFLVKLWLEETAEEAETARWRGHVTHIDREPSAKISRKSRRYIEDLEEIAAFILPYLKAMGVDQQ